MARPHFTPQQRAFLVREYDRCNRNVARVLERFREQYPNVRCPSRVAVYKNGKVHRKLDKLQPRPRLRYYATASTPLKNHYVYYYHVYTITECFTVASQSVPLRLALRIKFSTLR